jgi:hypothetical protein
MVRNGAGKIIGGPYYSLSYAEEKEREATESKRREQRKQKEKRRDS